MLVRGSKIFINTYLILHFYKHPSSLFTSSEAHKIDNKDEEEEEDEAEDEAKADEKEIINIGIKIF